ncbi:MAG: small acid-soluble spore protein SspI [Paenibacillus sp. RIFOXYA1_FULL_44_5]|nr:MAG: small acid-soluble spore protein SspI [Paenibacillus sp. RIFOXYA1_FULL_44_5]
MQLNLRQAIISRVQNKDGEELKDVIDDSIGGDDKLLPGLGVLFEIIWQNSDPNAQAAMISTLKDHLT